MTPRPKLIVLTILGTLACLGLAILGRGGFAAFFSHPALIALTVVLFLLSALAPFSAGNLSPGEREDRGNRWVLAAFGVISLLLVYVPAYDDRMELWTIDGDAVRWLGVVLFAAGGALRMCAWGLWRDPPSQLSRPPRQLAGMGARLSFRARRVAHGAAPPAAHRAH